MLPLETKSVVLDRGIEHDGAVLTSITLREITIGDHLDITAMGLADNLSEVTLIARLSGLPVEVIRTMRPTDYQRAQSALVELVALANGETAPSATGADKKPRHRRPAKG